MQTERSNQVPTIDLSRITIYWRPLVAYATEFELDKKSCQIRKLIFRLAIGQKLRHIGNQITIGRWLDEVS